MFTQNMKFHDLNMCVDVSQGTNRAKKCLKVDYWMTRKYRKPVVCSTNHSWERKITFFPVANGFPDSNWLPYGAWWLFKRPVSSALEVRHFINAEFLMSQKFWNRPLCIFFTASHSYCDFLCSQIVFHRARDFIKVNYTDGVLTFWCCICQLLCVVCTLHRCQCRWLEFILVRTHLLVIMNDNFSQ